MADRHADLHTLESWTPGLRTLPTALILCICTYWFLRWRSRVRLERQQDDALAAQHGCKSVEARLSYKWPFALDLLWVQYNAIPSGHVLETQTPFLATAPTIRLSLLGEGYATTDPENIHAIADSKFDDYCLGVRRYGVIDLLGEGIFVQDGSAWAHSRELLRRQFARVRSAGLQLVTPHITALISSISSAALTPSGIVDLQPLFFEFTLSTTTTLLFGTPHSALPAVECDALRDNFDYAAGVSATRLRLAEFAWAYKPRRFVQACDVVRKWAGVFADRALEAREKYGEERAREEFPFILDLWEDMRDRDLVRDQLLHVLLAGRDTTACLLSWTFFHLVRNPYLIDRLKAEIAQNVPADAAELTRKDIYQLPFLTCCLNETLRLYPQIPVNVRFAVRSTVLPRGGGTDGRSPFLLRKGQGIGWSTYHMHRSEALYGPDARVYRPERWEDDDLLKRMRDSGAGFLDFHAGKRICLGKDFALMEASYAVVRILQAFPGMRLPPGEPNEPVGAEKQTLTLVVSSADGAKVMLK